MKLLAFIPIRLTLLLILGILIGKFFSFDLLYLGIFIGALFVLLSAIFLFEKNTKSIFFGIVSALIFVFLGTFCYTNAQPINHNDHYTKITYTNSDLWFLKIKDVLKPNPFSYRYYATVKGIGQHPTTGTILISIPKDSSGQQFHIDDEFVTRTTLTDLYPTLNPHQFDYKNYLKNIGIYHQMQIEQHHFTITSRSKTTLKGIASSVRNHIISKLKKESFGEDEFGVIQALLLGQRSDISEETYTNYQKAGAVHILAVSGLHIGILLLLIQFLLSPLKQIPKGRTIILLLSVIFLWAFAFIAGLSASIIRATTMFTFVAYALYLNRPSNTFNILALSILFILLFIDPNLLFQVGFQMSYAAVFAILWIFPILRDLWFPKNKVVRYFWQLLCVSIAAQLGVLPISLFYFHQFPGLFFVSNLIIVPALGVILGMGILVVFLSIFNWLPAQFVWLYNKIIGFMNNLIAWVARQESFIFGDIPFDVVQLILSFIVLVMGVQLFTRFNSKRILLCLGSVLCFQGYTIYQEINTNEKVEAMVLHKTKERIIFNRNGKELTVLTDNNNQPDYLISRYRTAERIHSVSFDTLKNGYHIKNNSLLIIDSTGVYPLSTSDKILLTQSPKINLDRLIDSIQPKEIIADGSNYKSYVDRWKITCIKNKIPFHYTGEKGAYYFK